MGMFTVGLSRLANMQCQGLGNELEACSQVNASIFEELTFLERLGLVACEVVELNY